MTPRRAFARALRPLLCLPLLLPAAAPDGGAVRADVELKQQDEDTVYTIRPDRKPGAPNARPVGRSRRGVKLSEPPRDLRVLIEEVSDRFDMDAALVTSVMSVESGFDRMAVSPKGARGLMQLMPDTAVEYGVTDVHDARQNVEGGVAYLRDLVHRYGGNLTLALAAYNAGPGAVQRAAGVPRFRETRDYLKRIESAYGSNLDSASRRLRAGGSLDRRAEPIRTGRAEDGSITATNQRPPRQKPARRTTRIGS